MTFQKLAEEYIIYIIKNFKKSNIKKVKKYVHNEDIDALDAAIWWEMDYTYRENFLPIINNTLSQITLDDSTFQSYWDKFCRYEEYEECIDTFDKFILNIINLNTHLIIDCLINDLYIHLNNIDKKEILTKEQKEIYEKVKKKLT